MDLGAWTRRNQLALEDLDVHLLHWQGLVLVQELLLERSAAAESLQVSLRRHADPSVHTLKLLEAQRVLLDHLEEQLAKKRA